MEPHDRPVITIRTKINAPVEKVWKLWSTPENIVKWNHASDDWHSPMAENDLRKGGKFSIRMEAKDGTEGFDFTGVYEIVDLYSRIEYVMSDGRKVKVTFASDNGITDIVESFEAEDENSLEMQRDGWQSILDNFKKYAEE